MAGSMERSTVHVEGPDDQHSIVHLLRRHGVGYDRKPWLANWPKFVPIGGIEKLLAGIETAVALSSGRAIGFVVDADSPLKDRWEAVRDRLGRAHVDTPNEPPAEAFFGMSSKYRSRVGVWLMPDNQHDGSLESFLRTLISQRDPLIDHATSATDEASRLGATFTKPDRVKALIHAWLAW